MDQKQDQKIRELRAALVQNRDSYRAAVDNGTCTQDVENQHQERETDIVTELNRLGSFPTYEAGAPLYRAS